MGKCRISHGYYVHLSRVNMKKKPSPINSFTITFHDELPSRLPRLYNYIRITRLVARSHHTEVEIARCKRRLFDNSL